MPNSNDSTKRICDGRKLEELIDRYVNGPKAKRNRAILKSYLIEGCSSFEEVAEKCDTSAITVFRVVSRYKNDILMLMERE